MLDMMLYFALADVVSDRVPTQKISAETVHELRLSKEELPRYPLRVRIESGHHAKMPSQSTDDGSFSPSLEEVMGGFIVEYQENAGDFEKRFNEMFLEYEILQSTKGESENGFGDAAGKKAEEGKWSRADRLSAKAADIISFYRNNPALHEVYAFQLRSLLGDSQVVMSQKMTPDNRLSYLVELFWATKHILDTAADIRAEGPVTRDDLAIVLDKALDHFYEHKGSFQLDGRMHRNIWQYNLNHPADILITASSQMARNFMPDEGAQDAEYELSCFMRYVDHMCKLTRDYDNGIGKSMIIGMADKTWKDNLFADNRKAAKEIISRGSATGALPVHVAEFRLGIYGYIEQDYKYAGDHFRRSLDKKPEMYEPIIAEIAKRTDAEEGDTQEMMGRIMDKLQMMGIIEDIQNAYGRLNGLIKEI